MSGAVHEQPHRGEKRLRRKYRSMGGGYVLDFTDATLTRCWRHKRDIHHGPISEIRHIQGQGFAPSGKSGRTSSSVQFVELLDT